MSLKCKYIDPLALRAHFKKRMKQRFNIVFNRKELYRFKKLVHSGAIVLYSERQLLGIRHRMCLTVEYRGFVFDVVYDSATKEFVTCKYLTHEKYLKIFCEKA